jgi:hypothetical protein
MDVPYMFSLRFRQASRTASGLLLGPSGIAHFVLGNGTHNQRLLRIGCRHLRR